MKLGPKMAIFQIFIVGPDFFLLAEGPMDYPCLTPKEKNIKKSIVLKWLELTEKDANRPSVPHCYLNGVLSAAQRQGRSAAFTFLIINLTAPSLIITH